MNTATAPCCDAAKKPFYRDLTFQVVLAIFIGVGFGYAWPTTGEDMKVLADGFIKLIKMVIAPIVFLTVTTGIAHIGDIKKVGRVGGKAFIYFEIVTTIALILGMVSMNVLQPGRGMDIEHAQKGDLTQITAKAAEQSEHSTVDFLMDIIPHSAVSAFSEGNLLQVLFFAVLFGIALASMGDKGKPVTEFMERISQVFFGIIAIIMKAAPLGAFGAVAFTVGKYGIGAMVPLVELLIVAMGTLALFIFAVLGAIARYYGFSIRKFIGYVRDEILIVLGTGSSETVLPRMMQKMERLGCSKPVVGLVLPTGYSFNLDGSSLYLSMCVLFVAQAYNIDLSIEQQLSILGIMLFTSKGAAGVVGSAFIVLAATVQATGIIPVEGIALLLGIDRFMSSIRAATNLIGNGVATVVIAKIEKEFDEKKALETYREHFEGKQIDAI